MCSPEYPGAALAGKETCSEAVIGCRSPLVAASIFGYNVCNQWLLLRVPLSRVMLVRTLSGTFPPFDH